MTYKIINTGSDGNATVIDDRLMLDIGLPWYRIQPYVEHVDVVFTTHQHRDHIKPPTVKALRKARPAVRFACGKWMLPFLEECDVPHRCIDVFDMDQVYNYAGCRVAAQRIPHDVPNCCWHVEIGGERMIYATDTCSLDHIVARGYNLYLVEGNYYLEDIKARIAAKQAEGAHAYEVRVLETHMCIENTMAWLSRNICSSSKYVLMHRHRD